MKTPPLEPKTAAPETENPLVFRKVEDSQSLYEYIPNGKYYAFVKFGGKKKRHCLGTRDLAAARRGLGDFIRKLEKTDASQRTLTLRDLCTRYLATIKSQAKTTVSLKTTVIERLLATFQPGPEIRVSKIKPSDLKAWIAGYEFGYSSYNHYAQVVKALFEIAVEDKAIVDSPAKDLKGKKIVKPIRVTPSFEEFRKIIADVRKQKFNAEVERSADFLEFMGLIGVGQAEIAGLQRQHVNAEAKQLTFFRAKTRTPFVVPIFPQAGALVNKLIGKPGMAPTDYLFPPSENKSHHTKGTSTRDGKKALAAACNRLKMPAYTQRSLRRMFITRCIEKGIDVKVIAQWQGHQDGGKLILGTYSHVRNTHAEEMAKLLTA